MDNYLERLTSCGVRLDDALIIISDFMRELDWSGLEDYCREVEMLYYKEA